LERILIIEDDHHILKMIEWALTNHGCDVKVAHDGIEAMEVLNGDSHFKLVITDIRMPGVDGNQVARYIREKMHKTPVIAISACPPDADKELFDSILAKPFKIKELMQLVDSLS
jgi:DNA-binding response OmpR family regulator